MPKYIIEREIPGAGNLTSAQLEAILQISNDELARMGPEIQWIQSYLTENKIYCIYNSPDKEMIMAHATAIGIPANNICEILKCWIAQRILHRMPMSRGIMNRERPLLRKTIAPLKNPEDVYLCAFLKCFADPSFGVEKAADCNSINHSNHQIDPFII